MQKICKNCAWSVFRGQSTDDKIIADDGISELFLCRKLKLDVYGQDRGCPLFSLADQYYQKE